MKALFGDRRLLMTLRLLGSVGILAAAGLSTTAAAQVKDKPASKPAAEAKAPATRAPTSATELTAAATKGAAQPKKPRVIDFEDETIRGTLTKPEGDFIDSRARGRQRSLIKVRRHFVPELLKSADDL
jgi:hypothetical protein